MRTAEAPPAPRPDPARARRPGRAAGVAGGVVSLAILGAVVWWALRQEPPTFPTSADRLAELGGAVVVYFLACAIRGERWRVLLLENGARPHRADTYGLIAVAYLGNNVLPARAGDALRGMLIAPRASTDTRTAFGTLVAERLCDVLVLGALFLLLGYGVLSGAEVDLSGRFELVALVLAGAVVLGAVAGALLHYHGHLRPLIEFLRPLAAATVNLRGRHGAEVLLLTALVWAAEGATWWLTAEAAGMGIDPVEGLYLLALASMMVLIPAGPGHAGTMDAALLIGARALDVASSVALTYLILLRFVLMVPIGIAGLVIGATRYGGVGRLLRARASS